MSHADIQTTMIYVHHVPQIAAADQLVRLVAAVESVPRLHPVSGHVRDTNADPGEPDEGENRSDAAVLVMPRPESNERTRYRKPLADGDYESQACAMLQGTGWLDCLSTRSLGVYSTKQVLAIWAAQGPDSPVWGCKTSSVLKPWRVWLNHADPGL